MAHKLIQTVTVGSGGASSIEFTNIPQTYRDLMILMSANKSSQGVNISNLYINGLAETNLGFGSYTDSGNTGSTRTGLWRSGGPYEQGTGSLFTNSYIYLPSYTRSYQKLWQIDTVNASISAGNYIAFQSQQSSNISPITSLRISASDSTWAQYSVASLYGIR